MKNFTSNSLFLLLAFAFLGLTITSCGEDDITACTDPLAENTNDLATITDNTLCVYAADKFIGTYFGMSDCSGGAVVSTLTNDSLTFEIKSALDADNPNKVLISLPIQGFPVSFDSTVDGNVLTVDALLQGLPFPNPADPTMTIMVDITASGTETYTDTDNSVTGTIDIMINSTATGALIDNGSCVISGTKQ